MQGLFKPGLACLHGDGLGGSGGACVQGCRGRVVGQRDLVLAHVSDHVLGTGLPSHVGSATGAPSAPLGRGRLAATGTPAPPRPTRADPGTPTSARTASCRAARAGTSPCRPISPGLITVPSYHSDPHSNTRRSEPGPSAITFAGPGLGDFRGDAAVQEPVTPEGGRRRLTQPERRPLCRPSRAPRLAAASRRSLPPPPAQPDDCRARQVIALAVRLDA